MIHERECSYCGFSAFGEYKCLSCGAPRQQRREGYREGWLNPELLYGLKCLRPNATVRVDSYDDFLTLRTGMYAVRLGESA